MADSNLKIYLKHVKQCRTSFFDTPFDLAYKCFCALGYDKKDELFFMEHASEVVDTLRKECWKEFLPIEEQFTTKMIKHLIDPEEIKNKDSETAITDFVETYNNHIYQLSLSNTQSRRSRAGKEFEAIIELLLVGAGIPMDSQGNIGKKVFVDKGLGKLVDVVIPGVLEFEIDKSDVVLISAKTTLRERWQEVPEEMGRTGAKEMYLATMDESVTREVLDALYEQNIKLTVPKSIKDKSYADNRRVCTFEQLLLKCKQEKDTWKKQEYSEDAKNEKMNHFNYQRVKHEDHPFVSSYYEKFIEELEKNE